MKIDMVNPIPANRPTPNMWLQVLLSGRLLIFSFIAIKENKLTPISLPNTSPKIIP